MDILLVYEQVQPANFLHTRIDVGFAFFVICVSPNLLLTLVVITRLFLHWRNIRKATRASAACTQP